MADLGTARRVARASLTEAGGSRHVQAFIGSIHLRDHFNRANGALDGDTPDEATSGDVWMTPAGGVVGSLNVSGNTVVSPTPTENRANLIDGGTADGWLSVVFTPTATPAVDSRVAIFLRCDDTPDIEIVAATWYLARDLGALTIEMRHNGVDTYNLTIAEGTDGGATRHVQSLAGPASGAARYLIEIGVIGNRLELWINGIRYGGTVTLNTTAGAGTNIGLGLMGVTGGSSPSYDDFFFTSQPSCPGAVDVDATHADLKPSRDTVAAGGSFRLHARWERIGAPTSLEPNRINIPLVLDNNANSFIAGNATQSITGPSGYRDWGTFFATHDGSSTGTPRAGTFRIRAALARDEGLATDYDIDSTNTGVTGPAGTTPNHGNGTAISTGTVSSITPAPPASGDPDLYAYSNVVTAILTLGTQPWRAVTMTSVLFIENGTTRHTATPASSGVTVSTTDTMDNAYDAALDTAGIRWTFPLDALGFDPFFVFTAVPARHRNTDSVAGDGRVVESSTTGTDFTEDSFTADPRLTPDYHMQLNNNTPFQADRTSRLTSDLGFVTVRLLNAKGVGINGITMTEQLRDANNLVNAVVRSGGANLQTATVATEAGWLFNSTGGASNPEWLVWDSQLPGGSWTHTIAITGPLTATGLLTSTTQTLTLLAASPSLRVAVTAGPPLSSRAKHMTPKETQFYAFVGVEDVDRKVSLSSTTDPPIDLAEVCLIRIADGPQAQYLNAAGVWTNMTPGDVKDYHTCTETPAGSGVYLKAFDTDATWDTHDIVVVGRAVVGGTPYGALDKEIVVGDKNNHEKYKFDAIGKK